MPYNSYSGNVRSNLGQWSNLLESPPPGSFPLGEITATAFCLFLSVSLNTSASHQSTVNDRHPCDIYYVIITTVLD